MWLLPSSLLGPVLIFWFSRTHKYSRAPGGVMVGPCLSTPATVWTDCCTSTWFRLWKNPVGGQVQTAAVGPLFCQGAMLKLPSLSLCLEKALNDGTAGRHAPGSASGYQLCSTQLLSRWNPPHFTDEHPEVPVTQAGLELMVSDSKSIAVFILPATSGTAPRRSWQVLETLT